ncbi:isoleucine--tRNA ligase [Candidatus Parcubacteria bacterium]|nr:isoleucine--tRNA ligase [Patescibacteria group bacterium]MCG2694231.1 isoleucine--tRNA ligase [Candidatus Parcubacteria bacterium]
MLKNIPQNEEKTLDFWKKNNIFKKSIEIRPENQPYVFYDGPPFATGLPHYGHIVASLMKDIVPRYWTMKGFRVERKWGWDCHGLPIENIIEKKLNLKSKLEIENYGIDKFNNACHATVLKYAEEWKRVIDRIGRWVDMENDYKTMDIEYMESVWWVFSELWKKGLIYEGHKAMHICPRCETPLSNFEVTQGYKDVKDISVTAKFKLKNPEKIGLDGDIFILAWTTTPWTLPGNVLLAVGKNIKYCAVGIKGEEGLYIIAKDRVTDTIKNKEYKIEKEIKGTDLVGLSYESLFPYFKSTEKAFHIVPADFVTTEGGTGVVHIAPAFGEDDYDLGKKESIGWVQHVGIDGRFTKDVKDFAGMEVKPKEDPQKTDLEILKWLAKENKVFSKEKYEHSYPHCWRCDSPLINYATSSWFVKVTDLKSDLLKNNKKIHWVPEHIKEGRFGKWLEGARDWAVSRNRFWGAPLPIWQSENGDTICVGSVKELEELSGKKITDIHKHIIDKIIIKRGSKEYKKVPEVLDCWFESGSMPYGQMHYPFENKKKFEAGFPAEFIAEGQDQTRGWFYTLHVLATALTCGAKPSIPTKTTEPAFKNVIVNGIVLAEDGKKMSKRLQNYPDPMEVVSKYGADAMRYYLATSPVMYAENLNFSEVGVREMYNRLLNALFNVLEMYSMYGNKNEKYNDSSNILDKWIIAKLKQLGQEVGKNMNEYKLAEASRPIVDFVSDLSGWHVRRSRDRIKEKDNEALSTLRYILLELAKISAPFIPFMAEHLHQELKGTEESVHLADWPEYKKLSKEDLTLIKDMQTARSIVEVALSLRSEAGIKVRQPLAELQLTNCKLHNDLLTIIADEVNIKKVSAVGKLPKGKNWVQKENAALNIELTEELKEEGYIRELIRGINALRKKAELTPKDKITLYLDPVSEKLFNKFIDIIAKSTVSSEIVFNKKDLKHTDEVKLDDKSIWIGIKNNM